MSYIVYIGTKIGDPEWPRTAWSLHCLISLSG